ncbi:MAG: retropepsin-like aspartic protease [Halobacteriota archaeon]
MNGMKCWRYREWAPWVPVRLFGARVISELAFIDTGAGYCVIHPKFAVVLKLKPDREEELHGFGSKEAVKTEIASLEIEVNGFRETVEVACIEVKYYSEKLPEVIVGRNFLNKYFITLNGGEICIKRKEET